MHNSSVTQSIVGAPATEKYLLTYGDATERKRHLVKTSQTPMGVMNTFTHDTYGNTLLNREHATQFDLSDRPYETTHRDANGNALYRTVLTYDNRNRVTSFREGVGDVPYRTNYAYDADDRVTLIAYDGNANRTVGYVYDKLNRITTRTAKEGITYTTAFSYAEGDTEQYGAGASTPLVSSITQGAGANAMNFAYTYDSRGNISSETRNGATTTYAYDNLGQLIRVNDPSDDTAKEYDAQAGDGTTWLFAYDRGGNILSKAAYAYTTGAVGAAVKTWSYLYNDVNWKDKLTSFDGQNISYDAIGNPLSDGSWTYAWQCGRQLKSMANAATGVTMEYTYDHNGLRTQKVRKVNGVVAETTEYTLHGKLITHLTKGNDSMHFYYDAQSRPAMVNFNGTTYSYVHNLQGDIVGILDSTGALAVEYKYDAWGKPTGCCILKTEYEPLAALNPFRYRGYVYDEETGLYYLRSRYYSTRIKKFLNIDILCQDTILGLNLFTYSYNDPICLVDEDGLLPYLGYMHKAVCEKIALENNLMTGKGMKIFYKNGRYGFADLIDPRTKEVWEVKKFGLSMSGAILQLSRYINGIWHLTENNLKEGTSRIVPHMKTIRKGRYIALYWYAGKGIIYYLVLNDDSTVYIPVNYPVGERSKNKNKRNRYRETSVSILPTIILSTILLGVGRGIFYKSYSDTGNAW